MSTLLEQASLVMIPSGYKEDVVYSVIPESGAGDLSFTRASDGTRINSAGLVENMPYNLLTYSQDYSNSAWSKNTTITLNATTAPDGTNTGVQTSGAGNIYRLSSTLSAQSYTVSVYAKANTATSFELNIVTAGFGLGFKCAFNLSNGTAGTVTNYGGLTGTATITNAGNGWYRCTLSGTLTAAQYYYQLTTNANALYIWGSQLEAGSTAKQYFATTNRQDVPRLTYQNGGGGCPSLLLEPQRTNLALYSDQFNNGYWTPSGCIVTANFAISPDGIQNADKILPNVTSGGFVEMQYTASVTSGTTYTYSQYVKANGYNYIQFIGSAVGFGTFYINYDIVNGVETAFSQGTTVGTITRSIQSVGNGWFRVSASVPAQATGSHRIVLNIIPASNSIRGVAWTSDGVSSVLYYGAQLEAGAYATSYIPTTSASVTRITDACFKTGISSLIGQSEGFIFGDVIGLTDSYGSLSTILSVSDGTTNNRVMFSFNPTTGYVTPRIYKAGSTLFVEDYNLGTLTNRFKFAVGYGAGRAVCYINGIQVKETTGLTFFTSGTLTRLGADQGEGGSKCFGKINQFIIGSVNLTNTELAQLTSL
jgi:hypothetical protein